MSYRRFFLLRIPLTLVVGAILANSVNYYMQNLTFALILLGATSIIGLTITTIQFTRLKDNPLTLNNGGIPVDKIPNVTDEQILDEIRRLAQGKPIEPEVIPPTKQITVAKTKDFNQAARDVVLAKFVAALEKSEFKVNVKGSIDSKGDMNFKRLEFGIKTGPQATITEKLVEPEKKKPQVLKRPQVG